MMASKVTSDGSMISPQSQIPEKLLTKCAHSLDTEQNPKSTVGLLKSDSPSTLEKVSDTVEILASFESPFETARFPSCLPQPVMPIVHHPAPQSAEPKMGVNLIQYPAHISNELPKGLSLQTDGHFTKSLFSQPGSHSLSCSSSACSEVPSLMSSQRSSQDLTMRSPSTDGFTVQPVSPLKNNCGDAGILPDFTQLDSQLSAALKMKDYSLPKPESAAQPSRIAVKQAGKSREREVSDRKRRNSGTQNAPVKHIRIEPNIQQAIPIQPARVPLTTRRIAKKPEKIKNIEPKRKQADAGKAPMVASQADPHSASQPAGQTTSQSVQPSSGQLHPPLVSPMHVSYDQSMHPVHLPLPHMFHHPPFPYTLQNPLMIQQHPLHQIHPSLPQSVWPSNQQLSSGVAPSVQMQLMLPRPGPGVQVSPSQHLPASSLPSLPSVHPPNGSAANSQAPSQFTQSIPTPLTAPPHTSRGYPQILAPSEPAQQEGPRLAPFQSYPDCNSSDHSRSPSLSPPPQKSTFIGSSDCGDIDNQGKTRDPWDLEVVGSTWQPGFTQDIKMRTKTGCLTCRRRRVKCDEKRPHCRNCLKSERVCLGYDTVFTRARNKRIEDLSSKRRACRNSWKMRISALLEAGHAEAEEDDADCFGTRPVVVRSWLRLVELFRDHVARDLDLLLGTDFLLLTAHRGANHLSLQNGSLMPMASELEAMRQIMVVVFPAVESSSLNILDANLPLEKLKTSDGYYVMQAIVESLSPDFRDHLAVPMRVTKRQQHDQPELMETWFMRLTLLGKLLHPQKGRFFPFSWKHRYTLFEMASQVLKAAEEDDTSLTNAVWNAVATILDLEKTHLSETVQYPPPTGFGEAEQVLIAKSQEAALKFRQIADKGDARGVLALLALSRGGCEMAQQALSSLQTLRGLGLALSEIPMLSTAQISNN